MLNVELFTCTDHAIREAIQSSPATSRLSVDKDCFWLGAASSALPDADRFLSEARAGDIKTLQTENYIGTGDILIALLVRDTAVNDRFHVVVIHQPSTVDGSLTCVVDVVVNEPVAVKALQPPEDPEGQLGDKTNWWDLMVRSFLPKGAKGEAKRKHVGGRGNSESADQHL